MNVLTRHSLWLLLLIAPILGWAQTSGNKYYVKNTLPNQYVIIADSIGIINYIKAQRGGGKFSGISNTTASIGQKDDQLTKNNNYCIEIINILIPFAQIYQLKPSFKKESVNSTKGDTLLIAMSLLPYTTGDIQWKLIQLDTISVERLHSLSSIVKIGFERINLYRKAGSPGSHTILCQDDLKPIVHWHGKYWIPSPYVLTEYFQIHSYPTEMFSATDMATINIKSHPFTKEALLQEKRLRTSNTHAQLDGISSGNTLQRYSKGQYEFWSNPSVMLSHPDALHYGSREFIYQPGI